MIAFLADALYFFEEDSDLYLSLEIGVTSRNCLVSDSGVGAASLVLDVIFGVPG